MADLSVLSPLADVKREKFELAPRLDGFNGKTIGLWANGKAGADIVLRENAELLKQRYSGIKFKYFLEPRPRESTKEMAKKIAGECDAVIASTSD